MTSLILGVLGALLIAAAEPSSAKQSGGILSSLFGGESSPEDRVFDDQTHYAKPGASPKELLEARGYLAQEFHFTTQDNYSIALTRGRNPLINDGKSGYKSKLPILFIHGATLTGGSYLVNSVGVRPYVYDESLDLAHMDVNQLHELVAVDPARKALPFLAMNFGYEVWLMERRGYAGSRVKIGHENRTLSDAFKAIPETLIGNAMDGFSLDANMGNDRPKRVRFARSTNRASDAQQEAHFSDADFEEAERQRNPLKGFKPKTKIGKIIKRIVKKRAQMRKRLGPLKYGNMLQAFFALAKLPSNFAQLVGNMTHDFIHTFDPDFWRFSLDEQVAYDYPGAVDLVLNQTGAPKLHTVGLSCGGAVILLALAEQPKLAEKISRAVLWSPSINMGSHTDIVYLLGYIIPMVQGYIGPFPFLFAVPIIEILLQTLCATDFMQRTMCTGAVDVMMGHSGNEAPMRPFMLGHMLQPTSSGEFFQLGQFARSHIPCKFNMNSKEQNMRRYGQQRPPCYDLTEIKLHNISFYGGNKDRLVSPDDIATTIRQMSVPTEMNIIRGSNIHFNHIGCFLHQQADKLILLPSLLDMERSQAADRADRRLHSSREGHQSIGKLSNDDEQHHRSDRELLKSDLRSTELSDGEERQEVMSGNSLHDDINIQSDL